MRKCGGAFKFIGGEARYTRLAQQFPERAEKLFRDAEAAAKACG